MRKPFVCALSLVLVGSAANAADSGFLSPGIDPARFGWTGVYVGGSAGYGWLRDIDHQFTPPLEDQGEDWVFGVHAGYLRQFGNFVAGAEFEAVRLDIDYDLFSFITVEHAFVPKARLGYAFDRVLLSGHAGGVYATTNFMGLEDWGWTVGAAVDYALTDNVTIGAQYSRYEFDSFDGTMIDASIDLVTARIGYKF